ncbi:MAG TPA: hypothetical protein VI754_13850 [Bacteriovoracaceae bacterium]|nr:hypothetical protein [Bacteriovoracaceae bacterium]
MKKGITLLAFLYILITATSFAAYTNFDLKEDGYTESITVVQANNRYIDGTLSADVFISSIMQIDDHITLVRVLNELDNVVASDYDNYTEAEQNMVELLGEELNKQVDEKNKEIRKMKPLRVVGGVAVGAIVGSLLNAKKIGATITHREKGGGEIGAAINALTTGYAIVRYAGVWALAGGTAGVVYNIIVKDEIEIIKLDGK